MDSAPAETAKRADADYRVAEFARLDGAIRDGRPRAHGRGHAARQEETAGCISRHPHVDVNCPMPGDEHIHGPTGAKRRSAGRIAPAAVSAKAPRDEHRMVMCGC